MVPQPMGVRSLGATRRPPLGVPSTPRARRGRQTSPFRCPKKHAGGASAKFLLNEAFEGSIGGTERAPMVPRPMLAITGRPPLGVPSPPGMGTGYGHIAIGAAAKPPGRFRASRGSTSFDGVRSAVGDARSRPAGARAPAAARGARRAGGEWRVDIVQVRESIRRADAVLLRLQDAIVRTSAPRETGDG